MNRKPDMKSGTLCALLILMALPAWAQPPTRQVYANQPSQTSQSQIEQIRDQRLAREWRLNNEEWARYRELMDGPLGIYSPNIDPLTALGIEASSEQEQRRYAELQVQAEALRVEKLLAYQRAYDDAWQRLYPGVQRVSLPDATPGGMSVMGSGRAALFVKDDCARCSLLVQRFQTAGTEFDLYMVGSDEDDARIRDLAKRMQVDPDRVRSGAITLNHDGGRWLSLGLPGDLPAVVHRVNGQWQRQQ